MNREPGLSSAGLARRDEILRVLVRAQHGRRRRALLARGGCAVMVTLGLGGGVWMFAGNRPAPPVPPAPSALAEIHAFHRPMISVVGNDPSVVSRLAVRAEPSRVGVIDDEELERLLAQAGRPTGFIRTGTRFLLASDISPPAAEGGPPPGSG